MIDKKEGTKPQGEEVVACRALCLGALIVRSEFEKIVQNIHDLTVLKVHEELIGRLNAWLDQEELVLYQSSHEKTLLDKPPGSWNWQEVINANWRLEALGVLLWSLSLLDELPPYDTEFTQQDVLKPLGLFGPAGDFRKRVHLRPANAIESARGTTELWHWRSRTARIQDEGLRQTDGVDFPEIIKMVAGKAYQNGDIPKPVEDDFPAFDNPYAKLSQEEHSRATSIAAERHYALNGLCGYAGDWDETPAVFNI